ncbi:MAG: site-specific integrase [Ruminococcus sp.]|nr:site-specific integrase [Ruminococcus sp.]
MQRQLLTTGTTSKNKKGRWDGSVWYLDEFGERKRKSFSGKTQTEVQEKIKEYIFRFNKEVESNTNTGNLSFKEGMQHWLEVFKYPSLQRTSYDRYEVTAKYQIYPFIGDKPIGNITAADLKIVLNEIMLSGKSYSTCKKAYLLLNEYFRYLEREDLIEKNPMRNVEMMKKANYLSAQGIENKPQNELVTVFSPEEIELLKKEAFKRFGNGKPLYKQSAVYFLMLNTGLRRGEVCGLLNSDIDLEHRVLHVRRAVKEYYRRDGMDRTKGQETKVGPPKSATSVRDVPLNDTAIEMINRLREEVYLGEDTPLIPNEKGDFIKPINLLRRFYRLQTAAGIPEDELKGLHALRHTFATTLINGIKQPDGTIKSLTVKQVADLLGHTTTEITELYYVKKDNTKLEGLTDAFNL